MLILTAPTHSQVYEAWKAGQPSDTWRRYWRKVWEEHIGAYSSLGLSLIPISRREKQAEAGTEWGTETYSPDFMRGFTLAGGNGAIHAGRSDLVILDFDSKSLPPAFEEMATKVPAATTAKGFFFLTRPPFDAELFDRIKAFYGGAVDAARQGTAYELCPPSETCAVGSHGDPSVVCPHDFRIRTWCLGLESLKLPIPTFSAFADRVIGGR